MLLKTNHKTHLFIGIWAVVLLLCNACFAESAPMHPPVICAESFDYASPDGWGFHSMPDTDEDFVGLTPSDISFSPWGIRKDYSPSTFGRTGCFVSGGLVSKLPVRLTQKQPSAMRWAAILSAERPRFELGKPFRGLHAFQACLLSHSSISPGLFRIWDCKNKKILSIPKIFKMF